MKYFIVLFVVALIICACASIHSDITVVMPELNKIADGSYLGEYSIPKSPLSVKLNVIVHDNNITAIEIMEHNCSPLGKKAERIISDIIGKQSLDVDAITGATISSKTILKAVENALLQQ